MAVQVDSDKNWALHGVSDAECEEVFFNRPVLLARDDAHARKEARYYALGRSNAGRGLFVAFTIRGTLIRVISARDMNGRERRHYVRRT